MVLDTQPAVLNDLIIKGVLEFEWELVNGQYLDFTLSVTRILLHGGRMFVGWEDHPMRGNVEIILRGDSKTITTRYDGHNIGAKTIGMDVSLTLETKFVFNLLLRLFDRAFLVDNSKMVVTEQMSKESYLFIYLFTWTFG